MLIARDAYNGIVLWQRELAADRQRYSPRVVVAVGDRVFAVIRAKEGTPLVALDAANGQEVKTYDVGISPLSVLYLGGNLILAAEKEICSVNAETGKVNWRTAAPKNTTYRFQAALDYGQYPHVVSGDGRLFVFVKDAAAPPYSLVCYDAATGGELWRKRYPGELLKYYEGVLALLDQPIKFSYKKATRGTIHGISTRDGRSLWVRGNVEPLHSDAAVFCSAGLLWVNDAGIGLVGLDPATGSERKQLKTRMTGHCGYVRTTEQYFIGVFSRFVSNETGESFDAGCYKNACGVGQVPANGLVYTFPIACSCCPYLRGFLAFAPTDEAPKGVERPGTLRELLGVTPAPAEGADDTATKEPDRLEKGRAYGVQPKPEAADAGTEWATFRHDNRRSGSTAGTLSPEMKLLWSRSVTDQERTPYGRSMTPPVVAEGAVFVAAPDAHHVCALDAATGRVRWRYLLDGRVEAPPTVYCGLCLFGANDGWVYCLRANDGELVWRFRAAPQEHRFMACDRLESPWPVPGVLVEQGVAYFAAGRHARSHDGIALYALDPFTGKMLWRKSLRKVRSWTGGFMVNDLLVSNGKSVFMSIWRYDPKTGEQNGNWKDEKYLRSGSGRYGGGCAVLPFGLLYDRKEGPALTFPWPYQGVHGSHGPWSQPTYWHYRGVEGLLLVFTDERVFGVVPEKPRGQVPWQIFAKRPDDSIRPVGDEGGKQPKSAFAPVWSVTVRPKSVQALLSAGPTLFAAGSGNDPTRGALWAYSARDGKRLGELRFGDVPVFDGLAAAHGRLYVSSEGGKVFCFGGKQVLTAE